MHPDMTRSERKLAQNYCDHQRLLLNVFKVHIIMTSSSGFIFFMTTDFVSSFFFILFTKGHRNLSITDACILYCINNSDLCLSGKTFYTGKHGAMVYVTYFM